MSYEGYFDSVINIWKNKEKKTAALKRDMKVIFQQFQTSVDCGEIPKDKVEELRRKFKEIYHEVYD